MTSIFLINRQHQRAMVWQAPHVPRPKQTQLFRKSKPIKMAHDCPTLLYQVYLRPQRGKSINTLSSMN